MRRGIDGQSGAQSRRPALSACRLLVPQLPPRKESVSLRWAEYDDSRHSPWVGRVSPRSRIPRTSRVVKGWPWRVRTGAQTEQWASGVLGAWDLGCATAISGSDDQCSPPSISTPRSSTRRPCRSSPEVVLARSVDVGFLSSPMKWRTVDVNEGRPRPAALWGLGVYYEKTLPIRCGRHCHVASSPNRPVVSPRACWSRSQWSERPVCTGLVPLSGTIRSVSSRAGCPDLRVPRASGCAELAVTMQAPSS